MTSDENARLCITEGEAKSFKDLFARFLKEYKLKEENVSDEEWLEGMFRHELQNISEADAKNEAHEAVEAIKGFHESLRSADKAAEDGISGESWLTENMQIAAAGVAVKETGRYFQAIDEMLCNKNLELSEALSRSSDGQVNMNPNLDGIIAENMVAGTVEANAAMQGKNIKAEVLNSNAKNSVDVRVTNLTTGEYQNYQLKFGKDAKATIALIEKGNYNNQRIIVPADQLEEVQAYFKAKGSSKTISDHIEAWGAKGKAYTKEELKALQEAAQKEGTMPEIDYNSFQIRDLAKSIGKNAGVMALFSIAVTSGFNVAKHLIKGEPVEADELVEDAFRTGADTSVKVVATGALQVAVRKGLISIIPSGTPAGILANIVCVGIENAKILIKIASGELTLTKGMNQIKRVTISMVAGLAGAAKGMAIGAGLTAWIPVIGVPMAVVTGMIGGMAGYFAGSKIGDIVCQIVKKIAEPAKNTAKVAFKAIKSKAMEGMESMKTFASNFFTFA